MVNDLGQTVAVAGPSIAVQVWMNIPSCLWDRGMLAVTSALSWSSSIECGLSPITDQRSPLNHCRQMFGLDSVPGAGEEFSVWPTESAARDAAETFLDKDRTKRLAEMSSGGSMVTLSRCGGGDEGWVEG